MDSDAKVMAAFMVFLAVLTACFVYRETSRMDACLRSGESYARCVEMVE